MRKKVKQRFGKVQFMNRTNRKLMRFLCITFGITWLCWGSLAALIGAGILYFSHPVAVCLHLLGGFGPTIASVLTLESGICVSSVFKFVFARKRNVGKFLWISAMLEILVIGLSSMELNAEIPVVLVPLVFLQALFLYGGNEELGWRGIMQPILEKRFSFPVSALITGSVWGVWHLPLWFVDGSSQQNIPFPEFFLLGLLLSIFFGAVYKKTGCVFFCCVLHGLTNTLLSMFAIKGNVPLAVGLCILLIWSFILWYSEQRKVRSGTV